jgi:hypothetical protein
MSRYTLVLLVYEAAWIIIPILAAVGIAALIPWPLTGTTGLVLAYVLTFALGMGSGFLALRLREHFERWLLS